MNNDYTFKKDRLEVIRNFLELDFVEFIQDYISLRINSYQYDGNLQKFINGYQFYSDPLIETILQNSCEFLSKLTDSSLLPTYSYIHMLMRSDNYKAEINESSELSALISLGSYQKNGESDLNIDDNLKLTLYPGDLVIYDIKKFQPYRNNIEETWILQANLNFITNDGPNKDNIYDGRPYLGYIN